MEIRIIGEKSEIEEACKKLSKIFPEMKKSRISPARQDSYRCYIITDTKSIEPSQHK
ncbi:MAG: hypothetical protein K2J40_07485 [Ruminococcus sp.]|nr:hypothetical protein [Ruminococcus sp.]